MRIKITASQEGVKIAENALIRLGFDTKTNFAKSNFLSRTTVTKFFNRQLIQTDTFKKICKELEINWKEIVEKTIEELSEQIPRNDCGISNINEEVEQMQTQSRKVSVKDKQTKKVKVVITLEGDINSICNPKILQSILQEYSGDTIEITDIEAGSIRLTIEGSQGDIEQLISRIRAGELKKISGFPIEDIKILSESSDDSESNKLDSKWLLVQEIVTQAVKGRNLSNADLSNADLSNVSLSSANLSNADLSDADLSNVDSIYADLSDANLSGAVLIYANLSNANLSDANLSNANSIYANLSDANLSGADLSNANLSNANLSNANLNWAYLINTNLRDVNLSTANLSNANLRDANLSNANLRDANLKHTNLSYADLSYADLSYADLSYADLSHAQLSKKVKGARFINNKKISESMKRALIENGAIFEDYPGDRESVYSPIDP